jgi:hypothetical protein
MPASMQCDGLLEFFLGGSFRAWRHRISPGLQQVSGARHARFRDIAAVEPLRSPWQQIRAFAPLAPFSSGGKDRPPYCAT